MINYDVSEYDRLNSDLYRKEKRSLQIEFLKLQNWAIKEEKKIAVVFEGRDTAGKTDTINLLARHLIPDHFRYVHLGIPTPNESKKWFKRYEKHMPKKGEIVFFDRSWYTRATVEITMGYCSKRQYTHFMNKVVRWEKSYIEEDLILIKFYLSIEKRQQSKRIKQRQNDPLKLWKLSPNDLRMADKWEIFSFFKEQMFSKTSYEQSPWIVINENNKMVARLTALRYLLNEIDYEGKKLSKPKTWDVGINNYKIEHKGVEFTGLTYQQLKLLQKLIQNQSN